MSVAVPLATEYMQMLWSLMVVFLAGAVPLAFAIAAFGYSKEPFSLTDLVQHAARGFFSFIVAFVIYLLLRPIVVLSYDFAGIYGYYLAHHNLFFLAWCLISYVAFYQIPHTDTPQKEGIPILAYFTAFYVLKKGQRAKAQRTKGQSVLARRRPTTS